MLGIRRPYKNKEVRASVLIHIRMTNHFESTVLQDLASVNEKYKEEGEKERGVTHICTCTHGGTLPDNVVLHT
jgi:hypothetical protein